MALRCPWGVLSKVWCSTGRPAWSITQAARVSLWESIPATAAGFSVVVDMGYPFVLLVTVVGPRWCATMRRETPVHVWAFMLLLSDIHKGTRQGGNHLESHRKICSSMLEQIPGQVALSHPYRGLPPSSKTRMVAAGAGPARRGAGAVFFAFLPGLWGGK